MFEKLSFLIVLVLESLDGYALCNGFALKFTIPMFFILFFSAHTIGALLQETIRTEPKKKLVIKPIRINVRLPRISLGRIESKMA